MILRDGGLGSRLAVPDAGTLVVATPAPATAAACSSNGPAARAGRRAGTPSIAALSCPSDPGVPHMPASKRTRAFPAFLARLAPFNPLMRLLTVAAALLLLGSPAARAQLA